MKRFLMIFPAVLYGISVLSVAQASTEEPVKRRSMHVCVSMNADGLERKATPHLESITTYSNKYGCFDRCKRPLKSLRPLPRSRLPRLQNVRR